MPAFLVALVLLVTSAAPPEMSIALRTVVVRGTISDSATRAPLSNAGLLISADGAPQLASLATGKDGAFSARVNVPDSTRILTIRVRHIGYRQAAIKAAITGDTVTLDLKLVRETLLLESIVVTSVAERASRAQAPSTVSGHADAALTKQMLAASGYPSRDPMNTEEYSRIEDNRFLSVASSPLSTFSVDVDRASYTNVRRYITSGAFPPKDAVRIEELINYFPYEYREATGRDPVSITTDVAAAPWNPTHRVVRIGLQTQRIRTDDLPPSNLVFLLDVSGSMMPPNKLPLVKQAFRLLVNELREQDRVAIVVYAGNAGLVLPSTPASEKEKILEAIERLEAGGSTAGGAGIKLAYDVAKQNFMKDGNNRVILATDGDFNVGVSSTSELERLVEERRAEGTYLTVLGFGMGNYKDNRLETLADKGNGNYAYIDNLLEARKVFVHEFGATLVTVAKDVKLQIEFNPAMVQAYRLIGYENRMLRNEDFTNDKKDAGDMGAGHSVTALYDVIPVGVKLDVAVGTTDSLRYQRAAQPTSRSGSKELLFVNVRYKPPKDSVSRLLQQPVFDTKGTAHPDFRFSLAVAGYGMLLRDSEFKGGLTYDDVIAIARESNQDDRYRNDFITLVEATKRIARGVAVSKPE
ncbi:MAG TPA: von Willebrand factor type A domain-containing protein [Gemmatimonadaceae bacterium]|nr:von Willebrand factor type A domain-containing protein [Gemmatimonadaceae bacterium]